MSTDYDLFVIGGGSGGVRAANVAARHGARVGLAESRDLGGTCVNRGCVPKKLLVVASRFDQQCRHARDAGWNVAEPSIDWPHLTAAVERERLRLSAIYERNLLQSGVTIHTARARLVDAQTVMLDSSERITARTILIATGGLPRLGSAFPGIEHAASSDEMFHLPKLPAHLVVIGSGYIGLEFATLMAGFGSLVTVLVRGEEILKGFDLEIAQHLRETLQTAGIGFRLEARVERIDREGERRVVRLAGGETLEADAVLVAIGRVPNTAGLGLEAAGIALGKNGEVIVDENSRSTVSNVYAVGDVTDRVALTPVAIREGQAFADSVFGSTSRVFRHDLIPTAVFTSPEVMTVGLTEQAAAEAGYSVKLFREKFRPLHQALTDDHSKVLIKLVVDATDDRVLGAHAVGPEVGEWVQFLDILIRSGVTKAEFDASISVHPTMSEEFVTMRKSVDAR
jgi:glutathione reductase (NADPH)